MVECTPNYCHVPILLIVDLHSSLAYFMITHHLPIKNFGYQAHVHTHTCTHTHVYTLDSAECKDISSKNKPSLVPRPLIALRETVWWTKSKFLDCSSNWGTSNEIVERLHHYIRISRTEYTSIQPRDSASAKAIRLHATATVEWELELWGIM